MADRGVPVTEQQLLLAEIIKNPEEDSVRLGYADWLDERADEVVPCPECKGTGITEWYDDGNSCELCHGDRNVPARPDARKWAEFIRLDVREGLNSSRRNDLWYHFVVRWSANNPLHNRFLSDQWIRGMVSEITVSSAVFLEITDALIWHPGVTDVCPTCEKVPGRKFGTTCTDCSNGRVPRPCPLTAHPIRKVVLTTRPIFHPAWFGVNWPGIEFVLPEY